MKIIIIAAIAKNGVIGKANGEMPWHVKEEFQHFKETTKGYPVIMGRKTFETLGKPLKNRYNIIITRDSNYQVNHKEAQVLTDFREALRYCKNFYPEKCFIIGGAEIYKQAFLFADEMILSYMRFDAEGEVKFPDFNQKEWYIDNIVKHEQFDVYHYVKKPNVKY